MKAVVLYGPGQAALTAVSEPSLPKEDEILLRVRKVGLCGSDLNSYRGKNPLITYPRIPGHEISAIVAETNDSCPSLQAGSAVAVVPYTSCGHCSACLKGRSNACKFNQTLGVQRDGALTEFISVKADRILKADIPLTELCMVEPLTVGFHAVARGRVVQTDTVAVFGCGGVGLGAISGAAFRGATTIAVDVDEGKLETAQKAGALHAIHNQVDSLHDRLMGLTAGRGPDVIIEAIGLPQTFRAAVEEASFAGRVVYIGYAKEHVAYETRLFVQKELDILGSRNAQPEDFREVVQMLKSGLFPVKEAITHSVSMDDAPAMFAEWDRNPTQIGKIIVEVG